MFASCQEEEYGEVDFDMAQTMSDKSLALHNGPNILDSKAEQAYMQKDYDKALATQLKAVAIAPFASPSAICICILQHQSFFQSRVNRASTGPPPF